MSDRHIAPADIILFSAWRPPAPPMLLPEITVIESSAELRTQLAEQDADEYSRSASFRLLGNDWPVPLEEPKQPTEPLPALTLDEPTPIRPDMYARLYRDMRVISVWPRDRDRLEELASYCWIALVLLIGLCGALMLLAAIWPR